MALNAPPSARKSDSSLKIILIILGVAVLFCIVLGVGCAFMVNGVVKETSKITRCVFSGTVAQASLVAYEKEHGTFPAAATWQDDIRPYYEKGYEKLKKEMTEEDAGPMQGWVESMSDIAPPGEPISCEFGDATTGMAYNTEMAGKDRDDVKETDVLLFEQPEVGYNLAKAFGDGVDSDPPKIMGSERDWFTVFVNGNINDDMNAGARGGSGSFEDLVSPDDLTEGKEDAEQSGALGVEGV